MQSIIQGAGVFIYPLGICSFMAVFIIIERLLALRTARVMPKALTEAFVTGDIINLKGDLKSSAGRIVYFFRQTSPDPEALKAFARLEIARLERGMFVLEIVISGAPLLGLLGTIAGLAKVFSAEASASATAVAAAAPAGAAEIASGISLALTTTMLGLCIAIPTLVGNSYLNRRVDLLSARLDMGVERLIDLARRK
ncbi:MAG: MotA/TolQ/ExbB proton channel family protein [Opitutales bacterium]|jgi:biopolymer transport protein ExbB